MSLRFIGHLTAGTSQKGPGGRLNSTFRGGVRKLVCVCTSDLMHHHIESQFRFYGQSSVLKEGFGVKYGLV